MFFETLNAQFCFVNQWVTYVGNAICDFRDVNYVTYENHFFRTDLSNSIGFECSTCRDVAVSDIFCFFDRSVVNNNGDQSFLHLRRPRWHYVIQFYRV